MVAVSDSDREIADLRDALAAVRAQLDDVRTQSEIQAEGMAQLESTLATLGDTAAEPVAAAAGGSDSDDDTVWTESTIRSSGPTWSICPRIVARSVSAAR